MQCVQPGAKLRVCQGDDVVNRQDHRGPDLGGDDVTGGVKYIRFSPVGLGGDKVVLPEQLHRAVGIGQVVLMECDGARGFQVLQGAFGGAKDIQAIVLQTGDYPSDQFDGECSDAAGGRAGMSGFDSDLHELYILWNQTVIKLLKLPGHPLG